MFELDMVVTSLYSQGTHLYRFTLGYFIKHEKIEEFISHRCYLRHGSQSTNPLISTATLVFFILGKKISIQVLHFCSTIPSKQFLSSLGPGVADN